MLKSTLVIFVGFVCCASLHAQRNIQDSVITSPHLAFSYAYQIPGGDMQERFGNNSSIGLNFHIKDKQNWYYGVEASFLFGNTVKEPGLLSNLITENNEIIDNFGDLSQVLIQERGWSVSLSGGKLFNVIGPNPNSGILTKAGVGFIQHRIRLEHQQNEITQLEDEYLKGYDRLTNGLLITEFVGYYHMSNRRIVNFFAGIEAMQGFTEGRRDYNFDTKTNNEGARFDALLGLRVGWVINFYQRAPKEFYFD